MLTRYFKEKIKTRKFDDDLLWSMGEIKGKRVILLGAGEDFVELNKRYFFNDVLLITSEEPKPVLDFVFNKLNLENKDIRTVFNEEVPNERENLNYLYDFKFDKTLPKLVKKLNGKTVVLYGAGTFLELIKKYFNLSDLNIIGISDKRFENHGENDEFLGYKVYAPEEIKDLNPNYVLVSTKLYVDLLEDLMYKTLKHTKIKVEPLVKKPILTLIREIWEN